MASLQENLQRLQEIAANPKAQLDRYLKSGRQVVGCFPSTRRRCWRTLRAWCPMGIWGAQTEFSLAKKYLVPFACPIMQSCMELALGGKYAGVKAVMIPPMCDTLRCITQDFGSVEDIILSLQLPQDLTSAIREYGHVKERLEEIYEVEIGEEAIAKSIECHNHHSRAMRRFSELANRHLDIITPTVRHGVFKSAWFMTKAEHLAYLRRIIGQLESLPDYEFTGKRVILTGITGGEPDSFLKILEDHNMAVVGDDLAQEMRQYRTEIPEGDNGIVRLAKQWMERIDPMAHEDELRRVELLHGLCREKCGGRW